MESELPWDFITRPFKPTKTPPLRVLGSILSLSRLSFLFIRRPMNIPDIDELNSSKKNFLIKFAVPSAVFKAMFPLKPSVTITSALSEEKSLPSTNPTYSISPSVKVSINS